MFYLVINRRLAVWRQGIYGWKIFKGCWLISVVLWMVGGARVAQMCSYFLGGVAVWGLLMAAHRHLS